MTLAGIIVVYLAFRAKQLICDFFLQNTWMAMVKTAPFSQGGFKALAAHAAVHGLFTFALMLVFAPHLWWLGAVDFLIHGAVDKIKGMVTAAKGWTYKDGAFWWAFGIDQEMHNLTHLCYVIAIALAAGTPLH